MFLENSKDFEPISYLGFRLRSEGPRNHLMGSPAYQGLCGNLYIHLAVTVACSIIMIVEKKHRLHMSLDDDKVDDCR